MKKQTGTAWWPARSPAVRQMVLCWCALLPLAFFSTGCCTLPGGSFEIARGAAAADSPQELVCAHLGPPEKAAPGKEEKPAEPGKPEAPTAKPETLPPPRSLPAGWTLDQIINAT